MAGYVCPELVPAPVQKVYMERESCSEMDNEKPVHCAEVQLGAQLALQHVAALPALTPVFASFVIPAIPSAIPAVLAPVRSDVPLEAGTGPPYLRTLRLRI